MIPPTLQQSLAARLDRLGEARESRADRRGAGARFYLRLLRGCSRGRRAGLQTALDRLADAELLFAEGAPPHAAYRFKHALIQDAAYESLLKSRRHALHRRAAETLRDADAGPKRVAHHFTEAGLDDLAIEWWGKAGDQALRRSAFQEAIAHLGKAIEMTEKLAAVTPVAPQGGGRLRLQIAYGNALISARGYQAQETTAAFARARKLTANIERRRRAVLGLLRRVGQQLRSWRTRADAGARRRVPTRCRYAGRGCLKPV